MTDEEMRELVKLIVPNSPGYVQEALTVLLAYGQTDGGHHKMWVIDQAVRELAGSSYDALIDGYCSGDMYEWDKGIAP